MATFDELALAYDNSIDWNARLEREIPFILKSLSSPGNMRVLDMACGSGRHSIELAELGYSVDAFDTSSLMIKVAKKLAADRGVNVDFVVSDMLEMSKRYHGPYDLIICLGNSLALLPSFQDVAKVTTMVHNLISENGAFVFQTLNFDEIAASGFNQFEPKSGNLANGSQIVFKRHFDHSEGDNTHTILVLSSAVKKDDGWTENISRQKVLRINHAVLKDILEESGFTHIEVYSSYSGNIFESVSSRSMVFRVKKS